jgi:hypothetical protein
MSYNLLVPFHIITNASMATSVTSSVVEIKLQDNIGIQLQWTGTPGGTFSVQVSMDYFLDINNNVVNAGTWTTIPLTPPVVASGSPGNAYIDMNQLSAPYIRVVYTAASGAGTLNGFIIAKGV